MFDPDTSRTLAKKLSKIPSGDQKDARIAVGEEDLEVNSSLSNLPTKIRKLLGLE